MINYPYSYTVALSVDDAVFLEYCHMLEKNISLLKKDKLLIDVDGSETQVYYWERKKIVIHNSCYIDAVYIDSEINLIPFLDKPPLINTSLSQ